MTNKEIRNAVTQQIINLLENDILNEHGGVGKVLSVGLKMVKYLDLMV